MTKEAVDERVYLGIWLQRFRIHDIKDACRKMGTHILNHKHAAEIENLK